MGPAAGGAARPSHRTIEQQRPPFARGGDDGPAFRVLNGVVLPRATVMGGVYSTVSLDRGQTPFSTVMVLERIADLADDAAEDERLIALAKAKPALTPASEVEPRLRDHMLRDSGPSVMAAGGDWILRLDWRASLAAGEIGDGAD